MFRRARLGIGYLPQETSIFRGLTVEENVLAILETRRMRRKEREARAQELLERLQIAHLARQRADSLSGGERRRLEITRALAADPSFMLLDEPFTGIDPKAVAEIQGIVRDLRERTDLGFLITDHQVRETLEITDRSYIIDHGKVLRHGTPGELINDPEVRRIYLGDQFYMREHVVPAPEPSPETQIEAVPEGDEEREVAAVETVPGYSEAPPQEAETASGDGRGTEAPTPESNEEEVSGQPTGEPVEGVVKGGKVRETIRYSDKGLPISDAARVVDEPVTADDDSDQPDEDTEGEKPTTGDAPGPGEEVERHGAEPDEKARERRLWEELSDDAARETPSERQAGGDGEGKDEAGEDSETETTSEKPLGQTDPDRQP
jgi:LPS export ABC transporter ATP-binding protein